MFHGTWSHKTEKRCRGALRRLSRSRGFARTVASTFELGRGNRTNPEYHLRLLPILHCTQWYIGNRNGMTTRCDEEVCGAVQKCAHLVEIEKCCQTHMIFT